MESPNNIIKFNVGSQNKEVMIDLDEGVVKFEGREFDILHNGEKPNNIEQCAKIVEAVLNAFGDRFTEGKHLKELKIDMNKGEVKGKNWDKAENLPENIQNMLPSIKKIAEKSLPKEIKNSEKGDNPLTSKIVLQKKDKQVPKPIKPPPPKIEVMQKAKQLLEVATDKAQKVLGHLDNPKHVNIPILNQMNNPEMIANTVVERYGHINSHIDFVKDLVDNDNDFTKFKPKIDKVLSFPKFTNPQDVKKEVLKRLKSPGDVVYLPMDCRKEEAKSNLHTQSIFVKLFKEKDGSIGYYVINRGEGSESHPLVPSTSNKVMRDVRSHCYHISEKGFKESFFTGKGVGISFLEKLGEAVCTQGEVKVSSIYTLCCLKSEQDPGANPDSESFAASEQKSGLGMQDSLDGAFLDVLGSKQEKDEFLFLLKQKSLIEGFKNQKEKLENDPELRLMYRSAAQQQIIRIQKRDFLSQEQKDLGNAIAQTILDELDKIDNKIKQKTQQLPVLSNELTTAFPTNKFLKKIKSKTNLDPEKDLKASTIIGIPIVWEPKKATSPQEIAVQLDNLHKIATERLEKEKDPIQIFTELSEVILQITADNHKIRAATGEEAKKCLLGVEKLMQDMMISLRKVEEIWENTSKITDIEIRFPVHKELLQLVSLSAYELAVDLAEKSPGLESIKNFRVHIPEISLKKNPKHEHISITEKISKVIEKLKNRNSKILIHATIFAKNAWGRDSLFIKGLCPENDFQKIENATKNYVDSEQVLFRELVKRLTGRPPANELKNIKTPQIKPLDGLQSLMNLAYFSRITKRGSITPSVKYQDVEIEKKSIFGGYLSGEVEETPMGTMVPEETGASEGKHKPRSKEPTFWSYSKLIELKDSNKGKVELVESEILLEWDDYEAGSVKGREGKPGKIAGVDPRLYQELFSMRLNPEIAPTQALSWVANHPETLAHPQIRKLVSQLLFGFNTLGTAVVENKVLTKELIERFVNDIVNTYKNSDNLEAYLWALNTAESLMEFQTVGIYEKQPLDEHYKELLDRPNLSLSQKNRVAAHYLAKFSVNPSSFIESPVNEKNALEFAKAYFLYKSIPSTTPTLIDFDAKRGILNYQKELWSMIEKDPQKFGPELARLIFGDNFKVQEGAVWELKNNALVYGPYRLSESGKAFIHDKEISPITSYLVGEPLIREYFDRQDDIPSIITDGYVMNPKGDLRLVITNEIGKSPVDAIERKIKIDDVESWFRYQSERNLSTLQKQLPRIPAHLLETPNRVFIEVGVEKPSIIIVGQDDNPVYIYEGFNEVIRALKESSHGSEDWQKNMSSKIISGSFLSSNVSPSNQVRKEMEPWKPWKEYLGQVEDLRYVNFELDTNNTITAIHFDRLGLDFKLKDKKLECQQYPGFYLDPKPVSSPFKTHESCFILKNEKGQTKVIIPSHPFRTNIVGKENWGGKVSTPLDMSLINATSPFFVYEPSISGALKAETASGALYLAVLYRTEKQYEKALSVLKTAQSPAGVHELDYDVEALLNSLPDLSPEGAAFHLHFMVRMIEHENKIVKSQAPPRTEEQQIIRENMIASMMKIYNSSVSTEAEEIYEIPWELRLSENDKFILGWRGTASGTSVEIQSKNYSTLLGGAIVDSKGNPIVSLLQGAMKRQLESINNLEKLRSEKENLVVELQELEKNENLDNQQKPTFKEISKNLSHIIKPEEILEQIKKKVSDLKTDVEKIEKKPFDKLTPQEKILKGIGFEIYKKDIISNLTKKLNDSILLLDRYLQYHEANKNLKNNLLELHKGLINLEKQKKELKDDELMLSKINQKYKVIVDSIDETNKIIKNNNENIKNIEESKNFKDLKCDDLEKYKKLYSQLDKISKYISLEIDIYIQEPKTKNFPSDEDLGLYIPKTKAPSSYPGYNPNKIPVLKEGRLDVVVSPLQSYLYKNFNSIYGDLRSGKPEYRERAQSHLIEISKLGDDTSSHLLQLLLYASTLDPKTLPKGNTNSIIITLLIRAYHEVNPPGMEGRSSGQYPTFILSKFRIPHDETKYNFLLNDVKKNSNGVATIKLLKDIIPEGVEKLGENQKKIEELEKNEDVRQLMYRVDEAVEERKAAQEYFGLLFQKKQLVNQDKDENKWGSLQIIERDIDSVKSALNLEPNEKIKESYQFILGELEKEKIAKTNDLEKIQESINKIPEKIKKLASWSKTNPNEYKRDNEYLSLKKDVQAIEKTKNDFVNNLPQEVKKLEPKNPQFKNIPDYSSTTSIKEPLSETYRKPSLLQCYLWKNFNTMYTALDNDRDNVLNHLLKLSGQCGSYGSTTPEGQLIQLLLFASMLTPEKRALLVKNTDTFGLIKSLANYALDLRDQGPITIEIQVGLTREDQLKELNELENKYNDPSLQELIKFNDPAPLQKAAAFLDKANKNLESIARHQEMIVLIKKAAESSTDQTRGPVTEIKDVYAVISKQYIPNAPKPDTSVTYDIDKLQWWQYQELLNYGKEQLKNAIQERDNLLNNTELTNDDLKKLPGKDQKLLTLHYKESQLFANLDELKAIVQRYVKAVEYISKDGSRIQDLQNILDVKEPKKTNEITPLEKIKFEISFKDNSFIFEENNKSQVAPLGKLFESHFTKQIDKRSEEKLETAGVSKTDFFNENDVKGPIAKEKVRALNKAQKELLDLETSDYTPKVENSIEEVVKFSKENKDQFQEKAKELRNEALTKANELLGDEKEIKGIKTLKSGKQKQQQLTLPDLLSAYLKQDMSKLKEVNPTLDETRVKEIFKLLMEADLNTFRSKQCEEIIKISETPSSEEVNIDEVNKEKNKKIAAITDQRIDLEILQKYPQLSAYVATTGIWPRQDQIEAIDWALKELEGGRNPAARLLQMGAGAGKTKVFSVIVAMIAQSRGFGITFLNISNLYDFGKEDLQVSLNKACAMNTERVEWKVGRDQVTQQKLEVLYQNQLRWEESGKICVMTPETWHLINIARKMGLRNKDDGLIEAAKKVLTHFQKSFTIPDEAHLIFNPLTEVNQSIGTPKHLAGHVTDRLIKNYEILMGVKDLKIDENEQASVSDEVKERAQKLLIKDFVSDWKNNKKFDFKYWENQGLNEKSLIEWLEEPNSTEPKPKWLQELIKKDKMLAENIELQRRFVNSLLEFALSKRAEIDYGEYPSDMEGFDGKLYARPRHKKEVTTASFMDETITACLTIQMIHQKALSPEAVDKFLQKLVQKHRQEKEDGTIGTTQTEKLLQKWLNDGSISLDNVTPEFASKHFKALSENKNAKTWYMQNIALQQIDIFEEKISSTPAELMYGSKHSILLTATPGDLSVYPQYLKGPEKTEKSTAVSIIDIQSESTVIGLMLANRNNNKDSIVTVTSYNPQEVFKAFGDTKNLKFIIDQAGGFRKMQDGEEVLKALHDHNNNKTSYGVVVKQTPTGRQAHFVTFGEGKELIPLVGSELEAALKKMGYEENAKHLKDACHFFGMQELTGTDWKLPDENCQGILTIGENATLSDVIQAIKRDRKLELPGHSFKWVVHEALKEKIATSLGITDRDITPKDIICWLINNEAEQESKKVNMRFEQSIDQILTNEIVHYGNEDQKRQLSVVTDKSPLAWSSKPSKDKDFTLKDLLWRQVIDKALLKYPNTAKNLLAGIYKEGNDGESLLRIDEDKLNHIVKSSPKKFIEKILGKEIANTIEGLIEETVKKIDTKDSDKDKKMIGEENLNAEQVQTQTGEVESNKQGEVEVDVQAQGFVKSESVQPRNISYTTESDGFINKKGEALNLVKASKTMNDALIWPPAVGGPEIYGTPKFFQPFNDNKDYIRPVAGILIEIDGDEKRYHLLSQEGMNFYAGEIKGYEGNKKFLIVSPSGDLLHAKRNDSDYFHEKMRQDPELRQVISKVDLFQGKVRIGAHTKALFQDWVNYSSRYDIAKLLDSLEKTINPKLIAPGAKFERSELKSLLESMFDEKEKVEKNKPKEIQPKIVPQQEVKWSQAIQSETGWVSNVLESIEAVSKDDIKKMAGLIRNKIVEDKKAVLDNLGVYNETDLFGAKSVYDSKSKKFKKVVRFKEETRKVEIGKQMRELQQIVDLENLINTDKVDVIDETMNVLKYSPIKVTRRWLQDALPQDNLSDPKSKIEEYINTLVDLFINELKSKMGQNQLSEENENKFREQLKQKLLDQLTPN